MNTTFTSVTHTSTPASTSYVDEVVINTIKENNNTIDATYVKKSDCVTDVTTTSPSQYGVTKNDIVYTRQFPIGTSNAISRSTLSGTGTSASSVSCYYLYRYGSMNYILILPNTILPYTNNGAILGSPTYKFYNIYASTFTGNLSGTASNATADGDGNTISTTYSTKAETITAVYISGTTLYVTKNGSTTSTTLPGTTNYTISTNTSVSEIDTAMTNIWV